MNYYILTEDSKSFLKVLPCWLQYMNFPCKRVSDITAVTDNCFVLQSGFGVTQLLTKALFDTIDTINSYVNEVTIDTLFVFLDADEDSVADRVRDVIDAIHNKYNDSLYFNVRVLVINHCFETWILGGAKSLFPNNVNKESYLYPFFQYYDIANNDPELMVHPKLSRDTTSQYHFHYLHELLRYNKIRFNKSNIKNISTKDYFDKIVDRATTTTHIKSFKYFYNTFNNLP